MWLPRRRISSKPCFERMAQTSFPERNLSLTNRHLNLSYKNLAMHAPLYFLWRGCFEEKL
jgi:hypothetical protein